MTFAELNLNTSLTKALTDLGLTTPTIIQSRVFSVIMSGKDVLGIAQTGTGKTFAYLLPSLRQWNFTKEKIPQILIIVPTRELVVQVVKEVEKLTTYMSVQVAGIYGGVNIKPQKEIVHAGLDILVATPGRLLDLILDGTLKMKSIKKLIIDEVDEMLSLGFRPQLARILDLLPKKRQNIMFSATLTEDIENIIETFFNQPIKIEAAPTGTPLDNINQKGFKVPNFNTKVNLLAHLLTNDLEMNKVLVFTATKHIADDLHEKLDKIFPDNVGVIHSNKSQPNRFNAVNQFQNGAYRILIATDIISRGLDIAEVSHVINFETPEIPETYMHRIGRTGRADKQGISIVFVTDRELREQSKIEKLMNRKIPMSELPVDLEISTILTIDELPKVHMKTIKIKAPKKSLAGPAFHEKSEKNKKVNNHLTRAAKMKLKYGKSKTIGGKKNKS